VDAPLELAGLDVRVGGIGEWARIEEEEIPGLETNVRDMLGGEGLGVEDPL